MRDTDTKSGAEAICPECVDHAVNPRSSNNDTTGKTAVAEKSIDIGGIDGDVDSLREVMRTVPAGFMGDEASSQNEVE